MTTAAIKEKPILFQAPMVLAILAGTKTQTRRVVKPQPTRINDDFDGTWEWKKPGHYYDDLTLLHEMHQHSPWQVGDHLWVRETHAVIVMKNIVGFGEYEHLTGSTRELVVYRADNGTNPPPEGKKWTPGIHMFRKHSRITLEVTKVRIERLQNLSEQDAIAEGCPNGQAKSGWARAWYKDLWDEINGSESWDSNPWVWVVEFRRIK